jgi:hypothetical protein
MATIPNPFPKGEDSAFRRRGNQKLNLRGKSEAEFAVIHSLTFLPPAGYILVDDG